MVNKRLHFVLIPLLVCFLGIGLASCNHSKSLTIYSGRGKALIEPLFKMWENSSGIKLNIRYGNSTDLALLITEEGDRTPADIIISQSPGALGFLASKNILAQIPQSLSSKIRPEFRATNNSWLGITGRERVLVFNTNNVERSSLPKNIDELTQAKYKGRVAIAPNNSSFQDFITAMRIERGDKATLTWLEQMAANNSPNYPKNSAIVTAVVAGEVDFGLVNHYYLLRELAENPTAPAENYFFPSNDIGSLLIVTAGAITKKSKNSKSAEQLLDFLISASSQTYFVEMTREYSLLPNIAAPKGVRDLKSFSSPKLNNLQQFGAELKSTIELIEKSGIIRG